jgi:hypothetical protein
MRLTVRLDDDIHAVARALAQTDNISLAAAVNLLARRGITNAAPIQPGSKRQKPLSDFPVSAGRRLITPADVEKINSENEGE